MKRKIITTNDGSKTIHIEDWNEQYHSIHGALQEANHVFIKHGLEYFTASIKPDSKTISLLEIGFGTGLNAIVTLIKSKQLDLKVNYTGVEAYPVSKDEIDALNYSTLFPKIFEESFVKIHETPWESIQQITEHFSLKKEQKDFREINESNSYDIIYFDAFGARVQPELWTETLFKIMYSALKKDGILVTYSAKGSVRRAMQAVGFEVERLPGPPGKREMLRAIKLN